MEFGFVLSIYLAVLGLCGRAVAFSSCRERGLLLFWYSGFSWCWLLLGRTGSGRAGFSSCSTRLSSCDWMVLGHSGFQSCDTGLISCGSRASECAGFRSCGCLAPGHLGFSSCGTQLQSTGLIVVVQGLSCPAACGIFPDPGSNPCPLHWQGESYPLLHQESPNFKKSSTIKLLCVRVRK